MEYYDLDYCINYKKDNLLSDTDEIVDIYFVRSNHYCKDTDEYFENRQDEAIYLKVKTEMECDRVVLLAKNLINEYEFYFDNDLEKEKFYQEKKDDKFYNHLDIYTLLNDKQATDLLKIMTDNKDRYDYSFQDCNQDIVLRNILKSNLEENSSVLKSYQSYLEKDVYEIESMLQEEKNSNNIIDVHKRKK